MVETTEPIQLDTPRLDDAAAMQGLVAQCPPLDLNSAYLYLLLCHHFSETCVVARGQKGLAGFVSAYKPPEQPDTVFVWQVAVHSEARRHGLGRRMLYELLGRPSCRQARFLEATFTPSNAASQMLFDGLARGLGAKAECLELFTAERFPKDGHEPEQLIRIGPIHQNNNGGIAQ